MTIPKWIAIGTLWIVSLVGVAAITHTRSSRLTGAVPLGSPYSGIGVALERDKSGVLVGRFMRWENGRWQSFERDLGPMAGF